MEHSNAARTLHRPTTALLEALAADAVLSGSAQDMAYALSRLSMPPVEAIVSAARASDPARAHALLGAVAKTKPQWLSVEDEHGDSPSRVAARRLDHKSLSLLFRHGVPATDLLDLVDSYPHAATPQSQDAARSTRKVIVRALEAQGANLDGAVGTAMAQALANDDALGALELYRLHKVPPSTRLLGTFIKVEVSLLGELVGHNADHADGPQEKARIKLLERMARDFPKIHKVAPDELGGVLHRAASADFPKMVKSLIKLGFSPSARNEDGATPLHSAATNMDRDTIKALLSSGKRKPDLNARDVVGNTPLHAVFREIHTIIPDGDRAPVFLTDTLSILVESGASLSVRNNQGKTPLDLAVEAGLPNSVLRQLGATVPKKKTTP